MERFVDHGDKPQGDIVDGEFLVASTKATILLVPVDHALNDVPLTVGPFVEVLVLGLVFPCRDYRLDPAALTPASDARIAVALVSCQTEWPAPGALAAVEQASSHGRLEELALVTLPRRDVNGHNESVAVTNQMDFSPEATARTSERMVRRFLELRFLASAEPGRAARLFFSPRRQTGWPG